MSFPPGRCGQWHDVFKWLTVTVGRMGGLSPPFQAQPSPGLSSCRILVARPPQRLAGYGVLLLLCLAFPISEACGREWSLQQSVTAGITETRKRCSKSSGQPVGSGNARPALR